MRLAELAGRSVAVWGLGREGTAAIEALRDVPVRSLVAVDDQPREYRPAGRPVVQAVTGSAGEAALAAADVVIKSPGISRYERRVTELTARGVFLTSGTSLWMADHHDLTVGVTGSKGKSTTSSLISHLLTELGRPNQYGGNIGVPLLELPDADRYVVELSSYQCSDLQDSPQVAVLTALFPEHLNWHGSAERYFADKLNIVAHGPESVVYNALDERLTALLVPRLGRGAALPIGRPEGFHVHTRLDGAYISLGDDDLIPTSASPLRGSHNAINVCIALGALSVLGIDCGARRADLARALSTFTPLPHRLTPITDPGGLLFIDDSLSTAPEATIAAMQAFPAGPITLILGGQDRGISYTALREHLAGEQRPVLAIGLPESGPRILAAIDGLDGVRCLTADDLEQAVALARHETPADGTVLLSPGAPSYGHFQNYAERGAAFATAIARSAPRTPAQ